MTETATSQRSYEIASMKRGLAILDCFLASPDSILAVSDVARLVGIHRATVYRFLSTLEGCGYLESACCPSGGYRLAARLKRPSGPAEGSSWPPVVYLTAIPLLKELAEATGETTDVGVLHDGDVMLVQVSEGSQSVRVRQRVGARRPAHLTAGGKVLLAELDDSALEEWASGRTMEVHTPNSVDSLARLRAELAEIRRCGYAVDEQEFELGLACVAVPVRDAFGRAVAALAVSGPSSRVTYHRIPELVAEAKQAADRLSERFGVRPPLLGGVESPNGGRQ